MNWSLEIDWSSGFKYSRRQVLIYNESNSWKGRVWQIKSGPISSKYSKIATRHH